MGQFEVSGTVIMLIVRFIRSDRKMKARLGEVIFKVSVRVLEIVSPRGGLEKLSGEQAGIAKPEVESFIEWYGGLGLACQPF
jgi:hypothetical protein